MSEQQGPRDGLRAVPPALLVAYTGWLAMVSARLVYMLSNADYYKSARYQLVFEGLGFALQVLTIVGFYDFSRQLVGRARLAAQIALAAAATMFAIDLASGLVQLTDKPWDHAWVYKATRYSYALGNYAIAGGLALALWGEKRVLAVIAVVAAVLVTPVPVVDDAMFGWLERRETAAKLVYTVMGLVREGVALACIIAIARGMTASTRAAAASGLRLASRGLWLRVIGPIGVLVLTMMLVVAKGGQSSLFVLKCATITASILTLIGLVQFGVGALRAGRARIAELGCWPLVVAGAASLWAAGVAVAQLPWIYKMLSGSDPYLGEMMDERAQALTLAAPVVVIAGVAIVAIAISGFAAHRRNEELRASAQARGAGFVAFSLAGMAIIQWMVPKAQSIGNYAMLAILAGVASLVATGLMAKLLSRAADELETEPALPTATAIERDH
jgi:hypothetical protein